MDQGIHCLHCPCFPILHVHIYLQQDSRQGVLQLKVCPYHSMKPCLSKTNACDQTRAMFLATSLRKDDDKLREGDEASVSSWVAPVHSERPCREYIPFVLKIRLLVSLPGISKAHAKYDQAIERARLFWQVTPAATVYRFIALQTHDVDHWGMHLDKRTSAPATTKPPKAYSQKLPDIANVGGKVTSEPASIYWRPATSAPIPEADHHHSADLEDVVDSDGILTNHQSDETFPLTMKHR